MGVMASDTRLSHGDIGIDRLKIPPAAALDITRMGLVGMFKNGLQPRPFEVRGRTISFVYRPETHQPVSNTTIFFGHKARRID